MVMLIITRLMMMKMIAKRKATLIAIIIKIVMTMGIS